MATKKKKQTIKDFIAIYILLYRISVIVFFGSSLKRIIKFGVKRGIGKERFTNEWKNWFIDETEKKQTKGVTLDYGDDNKDVLIWVKEIPKTLSQYATLYHELYHAVDHIADSRAFNPVDKISEPKAYLFEYLFTEVSKVLWNRP